MCPKDTSEAPQPLGPQLFDEVCGAPPGASAAQLQETGYTDFAEWTPTDTWAGTYTDLLQQGPGGPSSAPQDAGAARRPSTSQSSQASGPEGARFVCSPTWHYRMFDVLRRHHAMRLQQLHGCMHATALPCSSGGWSLCTMLPMNGWPSACLMHGAGHTDQRACGTEHSVSAAASSRRGECGRGHDMHAVLCPRSVAARVVPDGQRRGIRQREGRLVRARQGEGEAMGSALAP